MPSRKVSTTTPKEKKGAMTKQQVTKTKPEVTVTEDSSPEEILHSSWLFINTFQFFHTFRAYFRLPAFDIERLENGLLQQEKQQDDHFIEQFFIQVLSPFLGTEQKKKLDKNNFELYLFKLFPEFEGNNSFFKLDIMDKIRLLKAIEDQTIDSPNEQFNSWRAETSPDDLRVQPLGTDSNGWTYWYFGDFRLYREIPFPKGKQGKNFLIANDFTFDLVCSDEEDWNDIMKKHQPSKRANGLDLATKIHEIGTTILNKLEAKEQSRLRNEAKLKKAKEIELLPKKRSRRLEAKFDEEVKRQKIEDLQKQQEALEEFERKKKKEEEEKHMKTIIGNLKEQVRDCIEIEIVENPENLQIKELQNQLSKQARESVRVRRMQGWIALFKDKNKNKDIQFYKEEFTIICKNNSHGDVDDDGDDNDNGNALTEPLLKNTLRVFLMTLNNRLENDHPMNKVYNDLMLDKYENLQQFNKVLDQATVTEPPLRDHMSRLLHTIFNEPFYKQAL